MRITAAICVVCGNEFIPYKPILKKNPSAALLRSRKYLQRRRELGLVNVHYNAPKYCSDRCYCRWRCIDPEQKKKIKEYRRRTHLKHREKDLQNNRRWWRKNRKKLKARRAEYQRLRAHTPEVIAWRKKYYQKNKTKERNRAYRSYYLGHKPKGDLGWLRKAKTNLRNVQRFIKSGETPEVCVSRRTRSKPEETLPI